MQSHLRHDYFEPDSFGRAVQDNLGDGLMLRLRKTLGGRDFRIPRAGISLSDDHLLVRAVGREDAERLCALFDGERVYIPALAVRDDAYMAGIRDGLNNTEIAERVGVTVRQVRRYFAARNIRNPNRRDHTCHALHPGNAAVRSSVAAE
ncbi:hypothetical protein [Albidovulum sp.]|uniref:hypothetical protein n=1 Tax=Albidovulum sp. TaxID=1872424 RepID=UPI0039B914A1